MRAFPFFHHTKLLYCPALNITPSLEAIFSIFEISTSGTATAVTSTPSPTSCAASTNSKIFSKAFGKVGWQISSYRGFTIGVEAYTDGCHSSDLKLRRNLSFRKQECNLPIGVQAHGETGICADPFCDFQKRV